VGRARYLDGMAIEVMCAFCGETVETGDLDPCNLIVSTRWDRPPVDQREQEFLAHADCVRRSLHPIARAAAFVLDINDETYRDNSGRRRSDVLRKELRDGWDDDEDDH